MNVSTESFDEFSRVDFSLFGVFNAVSELKKIL